MATAPAIADEPDARPSRFVFDFGGGLGWAFLTGRPSYAEQRLLVNSSGQVIRRDCGDVVCYQTIDPGFGPTFFLAANVRYNFTRRFGLALVGRIQFDTAPWEIPASTGGSARSNPFANLLLMVRGYFAVSSRGFAPRGFVASMFGGVGVGQIEPKPSLPANETRDGAHILSGYFNAHAGARFEYAFRFGLHTGAEVALQFMFPTFLFDIDTTVFLGFHL